MNPGSRHLRTIVTLTVLVVVLIVMAWWGLHNATAPFPGRASAVQPSCSAAETTTTRYVARRDVTVSVYNAGARQGFATLTLHRLEALGFRPGEVANAPAGVTTHRALVLTTRRDDPAAALVARTLGRKVPVEVTDETLGPGVDVIVGPQQRAPVRHPPRRLKLAHAVSTCVRVD